MGQEEYNKWSNETPVNRINSLNAPTLNQTEIELIQKANSKKILDIGCGDGCRLFDYLNNNNIKFLGIEKFERLVENSRYRNNIIIKDFLEIDINDKQFQDIDTITIFGGSLNGIFDYENHIIAWKKISNILEEGGKIIFDHLLINGFKKNDEIGEINLMPNLTPPQFFLSEKQLKQIWKSLELKIMQTIDIDIPAPFKLRYYLLKK